MKLLLMGLAVVASLVTSLNGALDAHAIPAVADCGGRYHEDCDFDSMEDPRDYEEEARQSCYEEQSHDEINPEVEVIIDQRAYEANVWADTYLADEKVVAVYWRRPLTREDCETGNRMGVLDSVEIPGESIEYVCDPNYGHAVSGGCVPADRDYYCVTLRSWGIANIRINRSFVEPKRGGIAGALGSAIESLPWTEEAPVIDEDWMLVDGDDHDDMACDWGARLKNKRVLDTSEALFGPVTNARY